MSAATWPTNCLSIPSIKTGVFLNGDLDPVRDANTTGMRDPNAQVQIFPLHLCAKSDTMNFKALLETLTHTTTML